MTMLQPSADKDKLHPSLLLQGKVEPVSLVLGSPPTCEVCPTNEFLLFEKIVPVRSLGTPGLIAWDVDYWCGNCETYYGFQTTDRDTDKHIL